MTPTSYAGGRYEVLEELGAGGMGRVFAVRVVATGARAALKELSPRLAQNPTQLERFRREATAMGALDHPHLVRCFDFGVDDDGTAFLVMELLEGRSLSRIVADDGPLDGVRAARLGAQVASALAAAHEAGIVHRDLKPSNVVVVRGYDGAEVAKVIDFGVAAVKTSSEYQRLTATGQIVGTPNYMAPEQLTGDETDARTDVYGLGALLYGILAARHPYAGATLAEIAAPLLQGDHAPLSVLRPDLGPLAQIVERAMSIDPEDRPSSMRELEAALANAASQKQSPPVRAKAPSPAPTAPTPTAPAQAKEKKMPRQGRLLLAGFLFAALAGALMVALVSVGKEPTDDVPVDVIAPPPVAPTSIVSADDAGVDGQVVEDAQTSDGDAAVHRSERVVSSAAVTARVEEATACRRGLAVSNYSEVPYRIDSWSAGAHAARTFEQCLPAEGAPPTVWANVVLREDGCIQRVRPGGPIDAVTRRCFVQYFRRYRSECRNPVTSRRYRVEYAVGECGTGG